MQPFELAEEVELLMPGHRELMARALREGLQRPTQHAASPGDQQPQR
jgi:hypothetical protein